MGLRGPKREKWPDALVKYIRDNAHQQSDTQIAASLTRITGKSYTKAMVAHARAKYAKVKKRPGRGGQGDKRIIKPQPKDSAEE